MTIGVVNDASFGKLIEIEHQARFMCMRKVSGHGKLQSEYICKLENNINKYKNNKNNEVRPVLT